MSSFKSSLESKSTFNRVIDILNRRFGELPTTGVMAGQAVASAVYDALGISSRGSFKDLDIYLRGEDLDRVSLAHKKDSFDPVPNSVRKRVDLMSQGVSTNLMRSSFDGAFSPVEKVSYQVNGCFIDPNNEDLNYIRISMNGEPSKIASMAAVVIDGFDINCCQVAIDMAKQKLVYTNHFEDFLHSKDIKIVNYFTPMHSLIRAIKKSREMDFTTFDQQRYIEDTQTIRRYIKEAEDQYTQNGYLPGHLFSDVYKQKFKDLESILGDYFELEPKVVKIHNAIYANTNPAVQVPFLDSLNDKTSDNNQEKKNDNGVIENRNNYIETRDMAVMNPKSWDGNLLNTFKAFFTLNEIDFKYKGAILGIESDLFYMTEIIGIYRENGWRKEEFINLMNLVAKDQKSSDGYIGLFNMLFSKDAKVLKQIGNDSKESLARLISQHDKLSILTKLGLSAAELRLTINNLRWLNNSKAHYQIGELENALLSDELGQSVVKNDLRYEKLAQYVSKQFAIDFDEFKSKSMKMYDDKINGMEGNEVSPRFTKVIQGFFADHSITHSIRELHTEKDLFLEGARLKHCVGSKWHNVKNAQNFIFSMIDNNDPQIRSTFSFHYSNGEFKFSQHKSYKNTEPHIEQKAMAGVFLRYCNKAIEDHYQHRSDAESKINPNDLIHTGDQYVFAL